MFNYSDPTGTNFLEEQGAIANYRATLQSYFLASAQVPNSAFTRLEAFDDLTPGTTPQIQGISWRAFPVTATVGADEIDRNRVRWQDEYIEWHVSRDNTGTVNQITFTTEFPEYFEALANVSFEALVAGIQVIIPGANPTVEELLGTVVDNPLRRARLFRENLPLNPWNNGEKGILCLTHRVNTLRALLGLLDQCGIPKPETAPDNVCSAVGGACVPGRNSDPRVCRAAQIAAVGEVGFSLADPPGIMIKELSGIWRLNGQQIDINDPNSNTGLWRIERGGHRAILNVVPGLTLDGSAITSGTQISQQLFVESSVITAPESSLPDWAKIGMEGRQ